MLAGLRLTLPVASNSAFLKLYAFVSLIFFSISVNLGKLLFASLAVCLGVANPHELCLKPASFKV